MQNYKDLMRKILNQGFAKEDRTNTGTLSLFGERLEFDLSQGFPLVTGKYLDFNIPKGELAWMLSGSTNVNDLNSKIWTSWADEDGELGKMYGYQYRNVLNSDGIDQITNLINTLMAEPTSRRMVVSCWDYRHLHEMALYPCHTLFQVVVQDGRVNLMLHQRSADIFLGVPSNVAFYSLLVHLLAVNCGLKVGKLVCNYADVHLYSNHVSQAEEYISRPLFDLPRLKVIATKSEVSYLWDIESDFIIELADYQSGERISAPVAV